LRKLYLHFLLELLEQLQLVEQQQLEQQVQVLALEPQQLVMLVLE